MKPILEVIGDVPRHDGLAWLRAVRDLITGEPERWLRDTEWEDETERLEYPPQPEPGEVTRVCALGFGTLLNHHNEFALPSQNAYGEYIKALARTVDDERLMPVTDVGESQWTVWTHNDENVETPAEFVDWAERAITFLEEERER